ncbi:hypothetical protein ACF0H5_001152 [Mactra antiquata]
MYLQYTYIDGQKKTKLIRTHPMFSFGLTRNAEDDEVTGYALGLAQYDSDIGLTDEGIKFTDMINKIKYRILE